MKKQEFLNNIIKSMEVKVLESYTYSALNTSKVRAKDNSLYRINVFVDRTTKSHGDRKLFIKFKSQYIHENIDACYKKLIKCIRKMQQKGLMDSVEIKKYMCCPNGCWDRKDYWNDMNALELVMDNDDCPWD